MLTRYGFSTSHLIEFARKEMKDAIGFNLQAHFYLAGGAFKTLLTGKAPGDLDLWASTEDDRQALINRLQNRGARHLEKRPFAEAYEINGRVIELPHKGAPQGLEGLFKEFDIGLSAVGVEYLPEDSWAVQIHPLAVKSIERREILLLKPLYNWKYALVTLERMRKYATELGFLIPPKEEAEIWRIFHMQRDEEKIKMVQRYKMISKSKEIIREAESWL